MCPDPPRERKFYSQLLALDEHLAQETREARCPRCGGPLHSRPYPRKPRGGPVDIGEEHRKRLSFCCGNQACRAGVTPFSVRFLGRKVYFGAVVVLLTALAQGVTPIRAEKVREQLGVSVRTLQRWREWWLSSFRESTFWEGSRARFASPVEERHLPSSLVSRFRGEHDDALTRLLRFLAPITTGSALGCQPV